jgi:hypothetical protein
MEDILCIGTDGYDTVTATFSVYVSTGRVQYINTALYDLNTAQRVGKGTQYLLSESHISTVKETAKAVVHDKQRHIERCAHQKCT